MPRYADLEGTDAIGRDDELLDRHQIGDDSREDSTNRGASDDVNRDAELLESFVNPNMGKAATPASAEYQGGPSSRYNTGYPRHIC